MRAALLKDPKRRENSLRSTPLCFDVLLMTHCCSCEKRGLPLQRHFGADCTEMRGRVTLFSALVRDGVKNAPVEEPIRLQDQPTFVRGHGGSVTNRAFQLFRRPGQIDVAAGHVFAV